VDGSRGEALVPLRVARARGATAARARGLSSVPRTGCSRAAVAVRDLLNTRCRTRGGQTSIARPASRFWPRLWGLRPEVVASTSSSSCSSSGYVLVLRNGRWHRRAVAVLGLCGHGRRWQLLWRQLLLLKGFAQLLLLLLLWVGGGTVVVTRRQGGIRSRRGVCCEHLSGPLRSRWLLPHGDV